MKRELLVSLIERARQEEMGLVVETNNRHSLISDFDAQKVPHDDILICSGPDERFIYLVKKSVELDP